LELRFMGLSSRVAKRVLFPADAFDLRPLTTADAGEAAKVIRAAFAAQRIATRPPSSALIENPGAVAAKLKAGGGLGVLAGGTLAGISLWRLDDGVFLVGRVAVLPEFRGRGFARKLIAACEAEARARGAQRMRLRARLELPENGRMFERFGFRRVRVEAHEGFDEPTTAVMEKTLS